MLRLPYCGGAVCLKKETCCKFLSSPQAKHLSFKMLEILRCACGRSLP
jgi:hypothetical protein